MVHYGYTYICTHHLTIDLNRFIIQKHDINKHDNNGPMEQLKSTARTNMVRHDIQTYQDSRQFVMTNNQVSDGLLSLRFTIWMERLSLSVINCHDKLSKQLCVFLKSTGIWRKNKVLDGKTGNALKEETQETTATRRIKQQRPPKNKNKLFVCLFISKNAE